MDQYNNFISKYYYLDYNPKIDYQLLSYELEADLPVNNPTINMQLYHLKSTPEPKLLFLVELYRNLYLADDYDTNIYLSAILNLIRQALINGADPNQLNDFDETILHIASRTNKIILELVYPYTEDLINQLNLAYETPFMNAVRDGPDENVAFLLQVNTQIDFSGVDIYGKSINNYKLTKEKLKIFNDYNLNG